MKFSPFEAIAVLRVQVDACEIRTANIYFSIRSVFVFIFASLFIWLKISNLYDNGFFQMDWNSAHTSNISFGIRLVCVTKKKEAEQRERKKLF